MGDDRPNPLVDVAKGLGLLFRAARTVVAKIPTGELEEAVVTSAKEVGRAFESVASTLEREVLGRARRPPEEPPREKSSESESGSNDKPDPPASSST
ncbi:MAG TPA: hypothetical protein VHV30_16965 [Polyangiaceae bacterium]|jgi:hypothetical protein|nr:hypothetical protein [Polyangiaceae bacterium]